MSRWIEIRGDQTLEELHQAIFKLYDRFDQYHLYEFQLGKRAFDPKGPNYGIPDPDDGKKKWQKMPATRANSARKAAQDGRFLFTSCRIGAVPRLECREIDGQVAG